jgi:hypothetical protein
MANAVAFESIEKQDLIRFAYGLVVSDVPHVDPAIWEHQLRAGCTLFGVWMPAATRQYVSRIATAGDCSKDCTSNSGKDLSVLRKLRFSSHRQYASLSFIRRREYLRFLSYTHRSCDAPPAPAQRKWTSAVQARHPLVSGAHVGAYVPPMNSP